MLPSGAKYPATVIERDLTDLQPHPKNPRVHTEEQIQEICGKIEKFGYSKISIVVQKSTNRILAGHGVVEALLLLGVQKALVYEVDLPDGIAEAFMIADNKMTDMSFWDNVLLADLLFELDELPEVELSDTGFSQEELESLLESDVEAVGELKGFGDFEPEDVDEDYVSFKFGSYSGRVSKEIYDSFVGKYKEIQENYDEVTLDDVLKKWLNV